MSGGSYQYFYQKMENMAEEIQGQESNPLRKAFADHLRLVAKAFHDIEWVDSCDYGLGAEEPAIRACLGDDTQRVLEAAIAIFQESRNALIAEIRLAAQTLSEGSAEDELPEL